MVKYTGAAVAALAGVVMYTVGSSRLLMLALVLLLAGALAREVSENRRQAA